MVSLFSHANCLQDLVMSYYLIINFIISKAHSSASAQYNVLLIQPSLNFAIFISSVAAVFGAMGVAERLCHLIPYSFRCRTALSF